jgi:hypothetical protein
MAKRTHILEDPELAEVLSVKNLKLPDRPKVVDIKFNDYQDWTGDDSLEVWAILDDATREEDLAYPGLGQIQDAIWDALRDAGETRLPYVHFGTLDDYEHRYATDADMDDSDEQGDRGT